MLALEHITVRYGGVPAVSDVSLHVSDGEIVAVIGPNGAGKTSLFDALSGLAPVAAGSRIELDGKDISRFSPERRCAAGIARTFQIPRLFRSLTVRQSLEVVAPRGADVDQFLQACQIADVAGSYPNVLPLPVQRRCEIARALASGGRVLLLDEVAAGLPMSEHEQLVALVRELAATHRRMIILVEHVLPLVEALTERVIVLNSGSVVAEGSLAELRRNPAVVTAYLGQPEKAAS
jgi:branched-chain amino acid transport system ATP-binding protein